MSQALAAAPDELTQCLAEIWRLLQRGVADRRSAFHTLGLGTVDGAGRPQLRTVVLRGCDPAARRLLVHTDARAPKLAEMVARPTVALLFYDAPAGLQLRLHATATVEPDGPARAAAWAAVRGNARDCYRTLDPPGTSIAAPVAAYDRESADAGRAAFRRILLDVEQIDWLSLASSGHRRARFVLAGAEAGATWLVP